MEFIYRPWILTTHQYTSITNAATAAAAASPMPRSIGASFTVNVAARGASLTLTAFVDLEGTLGLLRAIGIQTFLSGHSDHNPGVSLDNQGSRNNPKVPFISTAVRIEQHLHPGHLVQGPLPTKD
jgi:hypothetical protein